MIRGQTTKFVVWEELTVNICTGCRGEAINGFLCGQCRVDFYDTLASRLDKSYDKKVEQPWERVHRILTMMYGVHWDEFNEKMRW